jgi:hypothetical protein
MRLSEEKLTRQQAAELLTNEERGLAVAQAINRLLLDKGVYTHEEFDALYIRFVLNQQRRLKKQRPGLRSRIMLFLRAVIVAHTGGIGYSSKKEE